MNLWIPRFSTYDEAKAKIELEINLPQAVSKRKKRIGKLRQTSSTLLLMEGKGDDVIEDEVDDVKDEEDETKLVVKESIMYNEEKLKLKFNTCLILVNDIEHVVKNATNTWMNI